MFPPDEDTSPVALAGFFLSNSLLLHLARRRILSPSEANAIVGDALHELQRCNWPQGHRLPASDEATELLMATLRMVNEAVHTPKPPRVAG